VPTPPIEAVQTAAYQVPPSLREFDESETLSFDSLSAMDELVPHAIRVSLQDRTVR
jgi:hypothetical protein